MAVGGWYSEEGPGRDVDPPSPLLAVPNVTAHPSTLLLYNGRNIMYGDVYSSSSRSTSNALPLPLSRR